VNSTSKSNQIKQDILLAQTGNSTQITRLINSHNPRIIEGLLINPNLSIESLLILIKRNKLSTSQLKFVDETTHWICEYKIRVALVSSRKTPQYIALKHVKDLYYHDLAMLCRDVTLHPGIRSLAENYLKTRLESMKIGDRITLAKYATNEVLRIILKDQDKRVFIKALGNYRLKEIELVKIASDKYMDPDKLSEIIHHKRWNNNQNILKELAMNPLLGYAARRRVFERIHMPFLVEMIQSPLLNINHQKLARFVTRTRLKKLTKEEQLLLATSHCQKILDELLAVTDDQNVIKILATNSRLKNNKKIQSYKESEMKKLEEPKPTLTNSSSKNTVPNEK